MRDKGGRPLYVVTPHALRHFHAVRALDLGKTPQRPSGSIGAYRPEDDLRLLKADINHRRKIYEGFEV
ncbi:hypothetical protein [Candidatus Methanocrinis natronophilus]|uniref:Tyr recombinase domain-containing protein n=1 Tax=Candidatus Methanocrinis natronophilus TaxID=3033396 RepID=A0ABT5XA55_9EURY|nr:hypothetical protein [Candidatus Methanocrinis natronophilus]MDF0591550.1 hypothetical protein [Candidatus Methanocrinis natronophilus]